MAITPRNSYINRYIKAGRTGSAPTPQPGPSTCTVTETTHGLSRKIAIRNRKSYGSHRLCTLHFSAETR